MTENPSPATETPIEPAVNKEFPARLTFGVVVTPVDGFLRTPASVVLFSLGLRSLGEPEIVFFLGPRYDQSPIREEEAGYLSKDVLSALERISTIQSLLRYRHEGFLITNAGARQFNLVHMLEPAKDVIRHTALAPLTSHYDGEPYDFILYEPAPWLH